MAKSPTPENIPKQSQRRKYYIYVPAETKHII